MAQALRIREEAPHEPRPRAVARPAPTANPLLKYLAYRWATVFFLGGLLAALLAVAAFQLIPSRYSTSALVRVSAEALSLTVNDPTSRAEFGTYLKTQAALIRSYGVLHAAVLDGEVARLPMIRSQADPVIFLMEELKVDYQEGSELMRVTLVGDDAQGIAKIVNAVTAAYFKEVIEDETKRKRQRLQRIEETLKTMKADVEARQGEAKAPKAPSAFGPQLAAGQVVRLKEQLANADGLVKAAEAKVTFTQKRLNQPATEWVEPADLAERIDRDSDIQERGRRIAAVQAKIDDLKRVYETPNADRLRELETARDAEAAGREDQRRVKKEEFRKAHLPAVTLQLTREYDAAKEALTRARQSKRDLEKQLAEYQSIIDAETALDGKAFDFQQVELKDRQALIAGLIDRANLVRIDLDAPPRVRPLQPAVPPMKKDMKRQLMGAALAALAGFGFVAFLAVGYEHRLRRAIDLKEVQAVGPVLGALPARTGNAGSVKQPDLHARKLAEAADKLRGTLCRKIAAERKFVVVSGSRDEDGKNLAAWQLAASFERGGKRTLLIDGDLRQPRLHRFLNVENETGLSDLLVEGSDARSAVRITPGGLAFLPGGVWCDLVRNELASGRFDKLLDGLRQAFDVVVLNTHPVLNVAETAGMARDADAVLLCVRKHASRLEWTERARDRFAEGDPPIFGLVYCDADEAECWN